VVQLQVPRVFWVLDAMTAAYVAWWLLDDLTARRGSTARLAFVAVLALAAVARGVYVIRIERQRPLARVALPADAWTDVTAWLRTQPRDWHVLTHPVHASLYGSSVRVAAFRDTFLEAGKDTAMALYDRGVAMRVAERAPLVAGELTPDQLAMLDGRYSLDVFVTDVPGSFDRPVLYRNDRFAVYDLR
jgi:hypothetical protein